MLDSQGLFRWDSDKGVQLGETVLAIDLNNYRKTVLTGFSAGCNQILEAVSLRGVRSDVIILVSSWLPILADQLEVVRQKLYDIQVCIICGTNDDCRPHVEKLVKDYVIAEVKWIDGIEHEFPDSFESM